MKKYIRFIDYLFSCNYVDQPVLEQTYIDECVGTFLVHKLIPTLTNTQVNQSLEQTRYYKDIINLLSKA
jgi:hypothetical protein